MPRKTHAWTEFTDETRPQDPGLDGDGWTYENLEHGGDSSDGPHSMPLAIRATDAEGRWCVYVPIEENGHPVQSNGYNFNFKDNKLPFLCSNCGAEVIDPHYNYVVCERCGKRGCQNCTDERMKRHVFCSDGGEQ